MTINTIAKMAGVSPATVSRYLNQGYVSEEKKERIRNVIEQTGYSPSPSAQMLRTGKNHLVGVIVPFPLGCWCWRAEFDSQPVP